MPTDPQLRNSCGFYRYRGKRAAKREARVRNVGLPEFARWQPYTCSRCGGIHLEQLQGKKNVKKRATASLQGKKNVKQPPIIAGRRRWRFKPRGTT